MSQVTPIVDQTEEYKEPIDLKEENPPLETDNTHTVDPSLEAFNDALKDMQNHKMTTQLFPAPVSCLQACDSGVAVGLKNGRVSFVRCGQTTELMDLKGSIHKGGVTCLEVTSDDSLLVTTGEKSVKVWSLTEQRELATLEGHSSWVHALCVTPDGRFAVSGSLDKTARVWGLRELVAVATLQGHTGQVNCLVATLDGKLVLTGSWDATVKVWKCEDWTEAATFTGHKKQVECLAVTCDSLHAMSGSQDCTIIMWSLVTNTSVATLSGHTNSVRTLAVSPDGMYAVSTSFDKSIKLWRLEDKKEAASVEAFEKTLQCACVTPNSQYVVAAGSNTVKVLDLETLEEVAVLDGHTKAVLCASVSVSGTRLATGGLDNTVRLWSLHTQKASRKLAGHTGVISILLLTPDGKHLLTASEKVAKLWSFECEREIRRFEGHRRMIECMAVMPNSLYFFSGGKDKNVIMWDIGTGQLLALLEGHTNIVFSIATSADGRLVASGSFDCTIKVWSIAEKRELATLVGHEREVKMVAITPDSKTLVSASRDDDFKVWSLETFQQVTAVNARVRCIGFTPDGTRMVTASRDRHVLVWSVATWKVVAHLAEHDQGAWRLVISSDGRFCATASMISGLKVWSLDEMREVASFQDHNLGITHVAFTSDGQSVISASWDKTVKIHDISSITMQLRPSIEPICSLFSTSILKMTFGQNVHSDISNYRVGKYNINSLHIFSYFNRAEACGKWMRARTPMLKGVFGSPITLALNRNAGKCLDAILEVLSSRDMDDSDWLDFRAITDDLPRMLSLNSASVVQLCHRLFCKTAQLGLPKFIAPIQKLPMTQYLTCRNFVLEDFAQFSGKDIVRANALQVEFWISAFKWNFLPGSEPSMKFLRALQTSIHYRQLLSTPLVSTLVAQKWKELFPLALGITMLYGLMLVDLVAIVFLYWQTEVLVSFFIVLNVLLLAYEVLQIVGSSFVYVLDPWNAVDLVRNTVSLVWAGLVLGDSNPQYLRLAVVFLCFLRGFTYFRTFTSTRIFVNITLQVAQDIVSFLLILAYSVFAFGVMASIMSEDESATDSWKEGFNMLMGGFDNSSFGLMAWIIFVAANVVNVIVMLNLLISIIGDAYDRAQMSLAENDNHEMFGVVLEFESILFWRRTAGTEKVLSQCKFALGTDKEDEWSGRVNAVANIVREGQKSLAEQLAAGLAAFATQQNTGLEKQIATLTGQVAGMQTHLGVMERKLEMALKRNTE